MKEDGLIKLSESISYIDATKDPLSANVVIVKGEEYYWVYDVGNNEQVIEYLKFLDKPLNIILSHFHPDHIGNIDNLEYNQLYLGKNTFKYVNKGTVVFEDMYFLDGEIKIHVFPIASSHAKGSVALEVDDTYTFIGDAAYPTTKADKAVYNSEQLLAQIRKLEKLNSKYICLSHRDYFVRNKNGVLRWLNQIYSRRQGNEPYIEA